MRGIIVGCGIVTVIGVVQRRVDVNYTMIRLVCGLINRPASLETAMVLATANHRRAVIGLIAPGHIGLIVRLIATSDVTVVVGLVSASHPTAIIVLVATGDVSSIIRLVSTSHPTAVGDLIATCNV